MKARQFATAWCVAGALALAVPVLGAVASEAKPKNATAKCTDGTYSTAKTKQGACSGHGGIAVWYADEKTEKAAAKTAEKETKTAAKTAEKETKTAAKATEKETKTAANATEKEAKTATKATEKEAKTATKATEKEAKTATKSAEKEAKTAAKADTEPRPSGAPADATAQCKDGTYSTSKQHSGACSHHGGVKTWFK
jgi:flagellar biosynthesis GTPase FlhF